MAELEKALDASPADQDEGLWPDHVPIVEAFLAVQTQWRTASVSGGMAPGRLIYVGLDYAGVRAGLEAAGIAVSAPLWDGLRVMEAEARNALNKVEG